MEILKKRWMAFIVAAVVITGSTVFSVHRTLGAEIQEVADNFYAGDYGTSNRSISNQLGKRVDAANGLISVASAYSELSDEMQELREIRIALIGTSGIKEKHGLNNEMQKAFDTLASGLEKLELTEREEDMLSEYGSTFKNAQAVIDSAEYNNLVREFERTTLNVFPTNFLKGIAFLDSPELFE